MTFNIVVTIWFVLLLLVIGIKAGKNVKRIHKQEGKIYKDAWIKKQSCPVCGNVMKSDNICQHCGNIEN